jgi:cytochrome c oxidase subunit 1
MTTSGRLPRPVEVGRSQGYRRGSILVGWLFSTDHKIIGHRYLITSFGFFLAGGIMAMIMRPADGAGTTAHPRR